MNKTKPIKAVRATIKSSEDNEQIMLMRWAEFLSKRIPELGLLFHIPNGGSRNKAEAAKLKTMGVKPGVPDLFLPVSRGGYYGLFIEMKYGKNKPTDNQKIWLSDLDGQGYKAVVCYGFEEAKKAIEDYLALK